MFVLSWHSDLSAVISHSASLSHTLTHIHEQTPEDVTGFFFRTQCALYFWFEFYALVSDSECIYENFQFPSNFITLWRCMCGAADDDDTWIASRPPQPLRLVNNNSYIQMTSVLFFLFFSYTLRSFQTPDSANFCFFLSVLSFCSICRPPSMPLRHCSDFLRPLLIMLFRVMNRNART